MIGHQYTFAILLFTFGNCPMLSAQSLSDSTFDQSIDAIWRTVQNPDSLRLFAAQWLHYYSEHPNTGVGRKALQSAFYVWGNFGDIDSIKMALPFVKSDSDIWAVLVDPIGNAYGRKKLWDNFLGLLDSLSTQLSHPTSLAEVYLKLAHNHLLKANDAQARQYFKKVLSINASIDQTQRAYRGLYEIDSLYLGSLAPDFSGTSVQGEVIRLSDFRGTNVLLEFTGTWCGPCLGELPYLKDVFSKYATNNFKVIAVSLDSSANTLRQYLKDRKIPWPHILAPEYNDNPIVRKYNVEGVPRIFLIDSSGRIVAKDLRGTTIATAVEKSLRQ